MRINLGNGESISYKEANALKERSIFYWLKNPASSELVGPFVGSYPRTRQYEGWEVIGFDPNILGTVIVKEEADE